MACTFAISRHYIQSADNGTGSGGFTVSLSLFDNVSS